tara:strand:+ start:144 stop:347 length:204 start_codon:yes stop_codon:yes gene_type:complete
LDSPPLTSPCLPDGGCALDLAALHTPTDSVVRATRDDEDIFEPGFELDTEEHKQWLEKWRDEEDAED